MSVAKVQEALQMLEALDDLLQDISPARISQWSWEQSTHEPLKSMRRMLENELVHQEKDALARYMQSNQTETQSPQSGFLASPPNGARDTSEVLDGDKV